MSDIQRFIDAAEKIKPAGDATEHTTHGFTLGDVAKLVEYHRERTGEVLPPETPVLIQRIHDTYFHDIGWTTFKVPDAFDQVHDDEYIRTFTAYVTKVLGRNVICIQSHY